jgi:hypothetical protein
LLALAVLATAGVLIGSDQEPLLRVGLLAAAFVAIAAIAWLPELRDALTLRAVVVATSALTFVSVVLPSEQSRDLWSYAMQGRIVAHYGANPYVHAPNQFRHDPLLHLVGVGWRGTRSVYGPLFTWLSTAIMGVTGTDRLPTRLAFQLLAALALFATMALLYRKTREPVVLLLIGVNPVIALEIVNPGRNDALVGLAILAGVLLAGSVTSERAPAPRIIAAAVCITLAALVKFAALAALCAFLLWTVRRHGLRLACRAAAVSALLFALAYALVGGTRAFDPLTNATDRLSRASIWQLARTDGLDHLFGAAPAEPVRRVIAVVGPVALLGVVVLGLLFAVSRINDPTPELVAAGALVAFFLAGSYVLASYVAWVLPIVVWRHRAGLSRLVLLWSALLVIAYQAGSGLPPDGDDVIPWLMSFVTVVVAVVAIVMLSIAAARRLRRAGPPASAAPLHKLRV